jgi:predicted nucleic acid-binding protein
VIIADTSGLLAALDGDEVHHDRCRSVVETATDPLIVSPFVLCELDYLVLRNMGVDAELRMLEDIERGAYRLTEFTAADVGHAAQIVDRFSDLGIGLADASVVVLANRFGTRDVLTLDERHFRAMQSLDGHSFRLLPADGE